MAESPENPLSQFEITPVHFLPPLHIAGYDISFTNSSLMMVLTVAFILLFLGLGTRKAALVPSRWQGAAESVYQFVDDMIRDSVGTEGRQYFPIIFAIFLFVLIANLFGMVPFAFTITSHIIVTFAMAIVIFIGVTLIGFIRHGTHFLSLFLPAGTPIWMAPFMIPIELVSYLARPVSLSLRLAANMLAGHILLKILAGFVLVGLIGVFPFVFMLIFIGFEIFIACLQAYIFTLLTCVYLNDAVHLH
jgi:F-type H+-transporting ATPase subunit a